MMARVLAVALNAYREAVRARVLHAMLALGFAASVYALFVGALSIHEERRVVADLGAASTSLGAVLAAIVLGSTTLHREIERKTIVPMLTRALRRHEYLVGKYLGTLLTLVVFIALQGGCALGFLAAESGAAGQALAVSAALVAALVVVARWMPRRSTDAVVPWSFVWFAAMAALVPADGERRLLLASCALAVSEVAIVCALASFFASFASPALTAVFTLGAFVAGREADALGNLPARVFGPLGPTFRAVGKALAHAVPNLQLYVPPRALLLGQVPEMPVWSFVASAAQNALMYALLFVTLAAILFQRRDLP
ncbi:ABC transporter permease [Pendulispora albinea]|uniref:ABC transporter permease n=1 Tax=Pendulispora albinea TaxID=2741071 RepID=A0ABZ2M6D9_9BACT